jgi:NAD(P)H-hydrate epimerase
MPVPVISVAQMREWERATWASGQTEAAVIARVGECVAKRALALTCGGDFILLLAGKGHNGDDVRAMRSHLPDRVVEQIEIRDPRVALPELEHALAKRPAMIVDGLFGIGLARPLDADWQRVIARVNESGCRVLAVDVPSGLGEGGEPLPNAIRAHTTVTVGAPKLGLLSTGAAAFVGRLEVATVVGLVPCPCTSELQWTLMKDFDGHPPLRPAAGHKGTFGHAAIVAGSLGYHGASVLAARGAQRARPGLVTLFVQPEIYRPVAAQLQAVMVHPWPDNLDFSEFTAFLFGPGLAAQELPSSVRDRFEQMWRLSPSPVITDASALEWLPVGAFPKKAIRVITPHPGEAARLLGCKPVDVQRDRIAALRSLSKIFGSCWVALKGHHTLIGCVDGEVFVNSSGNAGLAQGGSGDLLAGYIAGWLAQPALQNDPARALRYAVFEHGAAADRLSAKRENWIVEELANELGRVDRS